MRGTHLVPRVLPARLELALLDPLRTPLSEVRIAVITTSRILYGLGAMVALLIIGTTIGLIWADTSDLAGAFAGVTNVIGVVGIVLLLIALAVTRRRRQT